MRFKIAAGGLIMACFFAAPGACAQTQFYNIPAQKLDTALIALGQQDHFTIGGLDPGFSTALSTKVFGRMTRDEAVKTLLRGTGFDFVLIDKTTIRIVRSVLKPVPVPAPVKSPENVAPASMKSAIPDDEIIITASKQNINLTRYPATAYVIKVGSVGLSENSTMAAALSHLPTLATTDLGPGRNKVFIRGISDSSFSGPTQSTVGIYLGDLRLTYNAPEPDLRLYDIDHIEVIEGPQGTLYGAGSLGGIVRIVPKAPQTDHIHAEISAGGSLTQNGTPGYDIGGVVNLPLIEKHVGLRVVGYALREGGVIDNSLLGNSDTDKTKIYGGRASLRLQLGDDWTVDLNGVLQNINTADTHYAERGLTGLTHAANILQPHDNDFKGGDLVISKAWGGYHLVSSTGFVRHDLIARYDATGYLSLPRLTIFEETNAINLFTHETRLSHSDQKGNYWILGAGFVSNVERIDRLIGPPQTVLPLVLLSNVKNETAVFGEATQWINPQWAVTLGARLTYVTRAGDLQIAETDEVTPRVKQTRILPTAALSWRPRPNLLGYLRLQTGFRSGGIGFETLKIATAPIFKSDTITSVELGWRYGQPIGSGEQDLSIGITGSYTVWRNIQADLVGTDGLPFTANIGHAKLYGLTADIRWKLRKNLSLDAALYLNENNVLNPASATPKLETSLPDVAGVNGRVSVAWSKPLTSQLTLKLESALQYVGKSHLGTTTQLRFEQGNYTKTDASAVLDGGRWRLSLNVSNILNITGNTFAYGNPFTLAKGTQFTPLRPRTVRLGIHMGF